MKGQRAAYSVDWLQLFCSVPGAVEPQWIEKTSPQGDAWGNHRTYRIVPSSHFIKGYVWQREVLYKQYTIANIACQPVNKDHRKDGGAIKLNNAVLYVADWYFILMDVIATLQWQPLNITRVDLACDFNYMMGGLDPATFLRKYVCKQKASYLRVGSNKFCLYAQKEMRCTIYDSIRWGSRQSGVSVYMYNKTKELNEQHDKPWIRDAWVKANLSSTRPVWRVEISITSQGLGLKSMYNSLIHSLFVDELRSPDLCRDMFKVYAAKYFRFLRTDPKAKRKRDLKEVALLDLVTESPYKPVTLSESHDTGRMERIVSNKLSQLYDYICVRDFTDKYVMLDALSKVMQLYNFHHNIKAEVSAGYNALEDSIADQITSVFRLPDKEAMRTQLNKARADIEEWHNLAGQLARKIINKQAGKASGKKYPPPMHAVHSSTPCGSTEQQKP